ncbi:MAG TPA: endonuclease III [Bacillota bacterium]|nr:endonuclease III [Bacillota bacterium]HPZ78385.1 endonuclease III [Bacillota bacterium]HQD74507.1 endonuclease III [Bacillota bacterium]
MDRGFEIDWRVNCVVEENAVILVFEKLEKMYQGARSSLLEPVQNNPVDTLVATMISQATNDTLSSRAFLQLKTEFPDWEYLLGADTEIIEGALSCAGLYRQKAKQIKAALSKIKEDFGAITLDPLYDWPKERCFEYLTSLPGVGPKTAACVLAFGLGKPAFPVDTHVLRVVKRLGLVGETESASSAQSMLEGVVPEDIKMKLHLMLIEHGRRVCTARKPKCNVCILKDMCQSCNSHVLEANNG